MVRVADDDETMASRSDRRRFISAYTDWALLEAVAQVARFAAGPDAGAVSRPLFDAARAVAGHPDLPSAAQIVRRLGVPFAEVLARALAEANPAIWLARREARPTTAADPDEAAHSLRVVAAHLRVSILTPGEYRRGRAELVGESHARDRRRGRPDILTDNQIRTAFGGDWSRALAAAGLAADEPEAAERAGDRRRRGVSIAEALNRCIDYHGALPGHRGLERFAATHGFRLSRRHAPYDQIVAQVTADRTARGRWTPRPVRRGLLPDFTAIIPESEALATWKNHPGERRRVKRWDAEACIQAAQRYLREAPPGRPLTERNYADWAAEQAEPVPQVSSLQRQDRFAAIVAEAQRRHHAKTESGQRDAEDSDGTGRAAASVAP